MANNNRNELQELREFYESDLFEYAKYVNPTYLYGEIHKRVFALLQSEDNDDLYQLLLLPRGHLKSHCIAVWVTWQVTRQPWSTIVYLTAGEKLAKVQMYAIKSIFTSDEYTLLWPEMFNPVEGKRDKWTEEEINTDHPERRKRGVRDYTVVIKTVKSDSTGLHCSHLVLDDVVTRKFAYTQIGRDEVQSAVSQFASIKNPGAKTKAVGTRYHPDDLYSKFIKAKKVIYNELGEPVDEQLLWKVFEEKVENRGDGTGVFLWPREFSPLTEDWYGFNIAVLAEKKAEYLSLGEDVQFHAQYYNEPNDPDSYRLKRGHFKYYDARYLEHERGVWAYNGRVLRVFAGMDLAFTDKTDRNAKRADWTAIAVIGVDFEGYIYILELRRFKTDKYDVYYENIIELAHYWGFKKIRIETNNGGKLVKKEVDDRVRENGQVLEVEGAFATKQDGKKFERHAAVLEPRYRTGTILHKRGGLTKELEEEVLLERPAHDDLEDAVTIAVEISKPPGNRGKRHKRGSNVVEASSRFGGRSMSRGN